MAIVESAEILLFQTTCKDLTFPTLK